MKKLFTRYLTGRRVRTVTGNWSDPGFATTAMSTAEETPSGSGSFPSFDLEYRYDDTDAPREVTVYDAGADDITTAWITAGTDHAVRLDEIA